MCDALQGIRDQAHVLCFLQQSHCFRFVRSGCVTFSILSRTASTSQRIEIHSSFAARATALNDKMKQSAIAADSSVSGDHRSPGPPNSAGPADSSASSPGLVSSTLLSRLAEAVDL
jgi:hypothetical protein